MDSKLANMLENLGGIFKHPFILNEASEKQLDLNSGKGDCTRIIVDLSKANSDKEILLKSDRITVEQINTCCQIRLNSIRNPKIELQEDMIIKGAIKKFYLTNSAGVGFLIINSGAYGSFEIIPGKHIPVDKDVQSADASGGATIWDPTDGKRWNITDLIVSSGAALTLTFKDGSTTKIVLYLAANGGAVANLKTPLVSASADNNFTVTASGAGDISVTALGYETD